MCVGGLVVGAIITLVVYGGPAVPNYEYDARQPDTIATPEAVSMKVMAEIDRDPLSQ